MQVDNEKKDNFEEFETSLYILRYVEVLDDLVDAKHAAQLEYTKELIQLVVLPFKETHDLIEGQGCHEVDPEHSFQVVPGYCLKVYNFFTGLVNNYRSEGYDNISKESQVNDAVEERKPACLHGLWVETDLQWNREAVYNGENHDKQVELGLNMVVWSEHPLELGLLLYYQDLHFAIVVSCDKVVSVAFVSLFLNIE